MHDMKEGIADSEYPLSIGFTLFYMLGHRPTQGENGLNNYYLHFSHLIHSRVLGTYSIMGAHMRCDTVQNQCKKV